MSVSLFLLPRHIDEFEQKVQALAEEQLDADSLKFALNKESHGLQELRAVHEASVKELEVAKAKLATQETAWSRERQQILSKQKELQEQTHTSIIQKLEIEFGMQLKLSQPGRELIKSGSLVRVASNGKRIKYKFFLLNDILIYAKKRKRAVGFIPHRVLQLSLCRIVDFQSDPCK